MDRSFPASGAAGHMLYLPGGMVHSAKLGDTAAISSTSSGPCGPITSSAPQKQQALYEQIVAPRREAEEARRRVHVHRRADVAEGEAVLLRHVLPESGRQRLDRQPGAQPADRDGAGRQMARALERHAVERHAGRAGTATCSSATCSVTASWRWIRPRAACVRVVLDKVNGKPIDGPNDLVMDAKGGLYITDPQFTPEAQKSQPGTNSTIRVSSIQNAGGSCPSSPRRAAREAAIMSSIR